MSHENYLHRRNQLMRTFDRQLARVKSSVSSWLGEKQANRFMREARQEFEALIMRIPYIGVSSLALTFFLPTTRHLAVYRTLQRQDRTLEDAGRLIFLIAAEEWFRKLAEKRAIKSQQRRYPESFVLNYVEGDGREFDHGIDYAECTNCKFLQAENAFELAPYACATDKPISELLGWGLSRPQTIAEGFPTCSFRFKKGGATNVPIPASLQEMITSEPV